MRASVYLAGKFHNTGNGPPAECKQRQRNRRVGQRGILLRQLFFLLYTTVRVKTGARKNSALAHVQSGDRTQVIRIFGLTGFAVGVRILGIIQCAVDKMRENASFFWHQF